MTLLFPTVLVVLMFLAGFTYLIVGNVQLTIYWFAAGALNAAITYL